MDTITFNFASTVSTVKPSIAFVDSSNSTSMKIKCMISWSTEEKEEGYIKKKTQCIELASRRSWIFSIKRPHSSPIITIKCK